ncbi:MAG: aminotransferase class I/II-fold pyridoxal phosphate-dependent enzyme [Syntrophaceae bacterium]|nr:aminotransferase class I/II-fold pyridoxal phosphate-dependent enzyme [Syntrophaceae bacterium]
MKLSCNDLGIFGGKPSFIEHQHVGRPNIGNRERFLELINDMLDRRWLTNQGAYVQEFERRIASMLGIKHCVAMCNGTIALEIAIRALELKGEVIVPSFTFIATAHSLQWQEITPVFCDIDPATHHLDPTHIEKMITPRTTGILGVHTWGRPCDIEALSEIAERNKLKLLFDAAHAFACSHRGRMIGNFGNAEVFSFHATKFFNTMEGGAVVTNDDALAGKMRLMKNFGFDGLDSVIYIGTNGKMSEASAAMGLANLANLEEFIAANRRNYECYRSWLDGIPGISLLEYDEGEKRNYHYIILEVDEEEAGLSRDELQNVLWAENILARRYFYPGCHRMEPYRSCFPHARLLLKETERICKRVLVLPTGSSIDPESIKTICNIIRLAVAHGKDIRKNMNPDETG